MTGSDGAPTPVYPGILARFARMPACRAASHARQPPSPSPAEQDALIMTLPPGATAIESPVPGEPLWARIDATRVWN